MSLLRTLSKLNGKQLQEPRTVPPELLLIEVKNTAGFIAQEVDLLAAKDQAQKKKIASLEDGIAGITQKLEQAVKQVGQFQAKEKEYLGHIEALESQLDRLEAPAKQPSEELVAYYESNLKSENAEKVVYRALFCKLKTAFKGELAEDLDRLAKVMVDIEMIKNESLGLQNAYKSSLPEDSVSEDWRQLVDGVSEGLRAASKREQELLELQADLEEKIDQQIEAQTILAELQRKARGSSLLFSQAWLGDKQVDPSKSLQPRSAYQTKGQQGVTLQVSGTQEFGQSDWGAESKNDFSSVKYRLQQIKNKLV